MFPKNTTEPCEILGVNKVTVLESFRKSQHTCIYCTQCRSQGFGSVTTATIVVLPMISNALGEWDTVVTHGSSWVMPYCHTTVKGLRDDEWMMMPDPVGGSVTASCLSMMNITYSHCIHSSFEFCTHNVLLGIKQPLKNTAKETFYQKTTSHLVTGALDNVCGGLWKPISGHCSWIFSNRQKKKEDFLSTTLFDKAP